MIIPYGLNTFREIIDVLKRPTFHSMDSLSLDDNVSPQLAVLQLSQTIKDEFYEVAFSKEAYTSLDDIWS